MRLNLSGHFSRTDIQRYAGKCYLWDNTLQKAGLFKKSNLSKWFGDGLCKFIAQYLLDVDFVWKCVYGALPTRAVKQLIMFPIEVILFYSVAKMFERANIFAIVRTKNI